MRRVTDAAGPDSAPPEKLLAAFDHDGMLWCEKPMYVQRH
jgi:hypothetical protein